MTDWSLPVLLDRFHRDIEHKLETAGRHLHIPAPKVMQAKRSG
jgi:hypothetical protein